MHETNPAARHHPNAYLQQSSLTGCSTRSNQEKAKIKTKKRPREEAAHVRVYSNWVGLVSLGSCSILLGDPDSGPVSISRVATRNKPRTTGIYYYNNHFPQNPPSTTTDAPVVKLFPGAARNSAAAFNSVASPHRPMGIRDIRYDETASSATYSSVNGVLIHLAVCQL